MGLSRRTWLQITSTTLIRTVLNTGFRLVFPFQPILMEGFGISLVQITRMYSGQSLVGMISPFLASIVDTRGRRTGMLAGLAVYSLGVLLVLFFPTPLGFFLFLSLSLLGKSIFDPSLHAFFGDCIPYARRGFVMGLIEMSWSLSFFLGMPLVGFILSRFGLLEPFLVLAVLSLVSILVILGLVPADGARDAAGETALFKIGLVFRSPTALAGLLVMALICLANQLINVVFGVWLNTTFGMQIAALGGASVVIGLAELLGEGAVSGLSDRLNKQRAVLIGILGNILASGLLPLVGFSTWGAYLGLFLFFLTFEFTIVSLIPVMTGVLPRARGTVMALTIASANLGRGLGSLAAAPMYLGGFWINALFAALVNLLAIAALRYVIVQEES